MTITDPLARFSPATRTWFHATFGEPTQVQVEAWEQISRREHALVIAPTGSGKTLAAFLHAIDALMTTNPGPPGVSVLYVSPLKALAVDVERNLTDPLNGITTTALEMGEVLSPVRVGVRSGDTSASQRRHLVTHPPQILITTPESLFLMLSSSAAECLTGVRTVIIDEIHYLAGTKRGAHLAVSLERLEAMNQVGPIQRIGLSATVRPHATVASFLTGPGREAVVVAPDTVKSWLIDVRVPVEDMTDLAPPPSSSSEDSGRRKPSPSMWPYVEQEVFDLVMAHQSTICFCNSRRVAERLTNHLNALYAQAFPDQDDAVLARTHHGSISKDLRVEIEQELKQGRLACVVATNSLELGIDMGMVDLVIQVGAPPSVASGLQRIGRGGHQVSALSHGVLFPLSRSDLLTTMVVTASMASGEIEPTRRLVNPLDVLAQHLVSMCLAGPVKPETLARIVRGADPFATLPQPAFDSVVDMLTGKYPSDDFSELRPRLAWDRRAGTLQARPGARRLVTTSGGTIPDRGLFGVFMVGDETPGSGKHAVSRRVGELDEEMVYESRVGDVFTLGSSAWRIEEITDNQVTVSPATGQTGRLPFWHGDELSRPVQVGWAIQRLVAQMGSGHGASSAQTTANLVIDPSAKRNLVGYLTDQKAATKVLPDAHTILVESCRDETGAWRVHIHCQLGRAVLQPWAMIILHNLRQANGLANADDPRVMVSDDGITIRLGEVDHPSIGHLLACTPDEVHAIVAAQTQHSSLFTAHFRQCAARALLLPKRDPTKRSPLWQQRLRAKQLLGVAASYLDFPIIAEALRECLDDVFDLEPLRDLMRGIASRAISVVEVETPRPSPFAASMLFGYTGAFMYDYDAPLAERAAAANWVDPGLLASLLETQPGEVGDEASFAEVEADLQRTSPTRRASTMEALWDLVRELGPLVADECDERCAGPTMAWLDALRSSGRIIDVTLAGVPMVAVEEDGPLIASLPKQEAARRLIRRWMRHHTAVSISSLAQRYALSTAMVQAIMDEMVDEGLVCVSHWGAKATQYIHADVLDQVRNRAVAKLRAAIKPVAPRRFASFLNRWQGLDHPGQGIDDLAAAVEQLAGYPIPASMLESVVLPARVSDYQPHMLDQLMADGEVTWSGHAPIGDSDGWVCLWPGDPLVRPTANAEVSGAARAIYDRLRGGGAWLVEDLSGDEMGPDTVLQGLWELVWAGLVSTDNFAPVRRLAEASSVLTRPHVPRMRRVGRRLGSPRSSPSGRWFALRPEVGPDATWLIQAVQLELNRYGVLTRGSVLSEAMTPVFFDAYKVLAAMESQGLTRRGYFILGLGAAQFAMPGAVDALRDDTVAGRILVAACDPANPWGAGLPWPDSHGHRPSRKAGAIVVLDDGEPLIYLERGGHTLLTFSDDPRPVIAGLDLVGSWIDAKRIDTVTLTKINQESVFEARQWAEPLTEAGFILTPQGYRRRPKRDMDPGPD